MIEFFGFVGSILAGFGVFVLMLLVAAIFAEVTLDD